MRRVRVPLKRSHILRACQEFRLVSCSSPAGRITCSTSPPKSGRGRSDLVPHSSTLRPHMPGPAIAIALLLAPDSAAGMGSRFRQADHVQELLRSRHCLCLLQAQDRGSARRCCASAVMAEEFETTERPCHVARTWRHASRRGTSRPPRMWVSGRPSPRSHPPAPASSFITASAAASTCRTRRAASPANPLARRPLPVELSEHDEIADALDDPVEPNQSAPSPRGGRTGHCRCARCRSGRAWSVSVVIRGLPRARQPASSPARRPRRSAEHQRMRDR